MSPALHQFISIDLPPLLTGSFAALSCGLLGNFLVLRRQSLMGDAISHAVLPGIVAAFLLFGERTTLPMFLGAAGAGVLAAVLVELVRSLGRVESGAAMGVVFSVMFALGVLMIERAAARHVDLDADCVLHGMLETIFWFPPAEWDRLLTLGALSDLPRQVWTTGGMLAASVLFVSVFFKELRISSFDPGLATALGFRAGLMHFMLMVVIAAATVAAFEAVGSILVVAMLVCPGATARLLTDRLLSQLLVSAAAALLAAVGGYLLAAFGPGWLGFEQSVSAAGMMAVCGGLLLAAAVVAGPRHGLAAAVVRRAALALQVAREDLLGLAYREEESGRRDDGLLRRRAGTAGILGRLALRSALRRGLLSRRGDGLSLTETGRQAASALVRRHRLWESYLVREAGLRSDHVHGTAMRLEHLPDDSIAEALNRTGGTPRSDPHDRPIPPKQGV